VRKAARDVSFVSSTQYRAPERREVSRPGSAVHPPPRRRLEHHADDIAEYYIANYYDQVSFWIAERKAQA
jgi:hypothetical protein